jgi:hypothetical protein
LRIELDIERLTLNGIQLDRRQLADLREALVTELTRLLGERRHPPAAARVVAAPPIRVGATPDGADLGRQLARSVHRGLAGNTDHNRNRRT